MCTVVPLTKTNMMRIVSVDVEVGEVGKGRVAFLLRRSATLYSSLQPAITNRKDDS